jgi:hypothetical protein
MPTTPTVIQRIGLQIRRVRRLFSDIDPAVVAERRPLRYAEMIANRLGREWHTLPREPRRPLRVLEA